MSILPKEFAAYIAPQCDRCAFIQAYLSERNVSTVVLPIAGKKHIYVNFPKEQYNAQFKIKTVLAHYDRVEGSPGANDNSAANFCLMNWAVRLQTRNSFHNVRLLFSDGEELGMHEQGAFALAALFKRLGITHDDVYVFDCMGRGTVPILAKTHIPFGAPYAFRKRYAALEHRAENLLRRSGVARWLSLPFAYSDNAGFIACGIPSVAITMLPDNEANEYRRALMREKALENFVTNHTVAHDAFDVLAEKPATEKLQNLLPETWQRLHPLQDDEQSLTPQSFAVFAAILDALAEEKA